MIKKSIEKNSKENNKNGSLEKEKENQIMKKIMKKPELMAPAGDWTMLRAAVEAGADAVYLGLKSLTMRATARNFSEEDLKEAVKFCHEKGVKVYLTLNSIIFENQLSELDRIIRVSKEAGVDMIICWDHAVIRRALEQGIEVCLSTQASVSNSEAAKFYHDIGVKRVVLARECSLEEIKEIKKELSKIGMEVEVFVHGAMCVSISGRCFMSHHLFGNEGSANCGKCIQPCRREYLIKDVEEGHEFVVGRGYVMSPKDLCTIEFVDEFIRAGIDSLKIEGRKRSPEYVFTAVKAYKRAIDLSYEEITKGLSPGTLFTEDIKQELRNELEKVFNRGFNSGFYHGFPSGKASITDIYGSKAREKKVQAGIVLNYYPKVEVALVKLRSNGLRVGDEVMIQGPTTGVLRFVVKEMRDDNDQPITSAEKGSEVCIKVLFPETREPDERKVRKNDDLYLVVERDLTDPREGR